MSERQQHWGWVREEERKRETEGKETKGGAGSWEKQIQKEVERWQEEERARDEVEVEETWGTECWYQRTQWESTKCDPVV